MHVAARRHDNVGRLEGEPPPSPHAHLAAIHFVFEDRLHKGDFPHCQRPFPTSGAGLDHEVLVQWCIPAMSSMPLADSSAPAWPDVPAPMASILSGIDSLSPSAKVRVSSVVPPGLSVDSGSKTMT